MSITLRCTMKRVIFWPVLLLIFTALAFFAVTHATSRLVADLAEFCEHEANKFGDRWEIWCFDLKD
jgi:hypothetical protein